MSEKGTRNNHAGVPVQYQSLSRLTSQAFPLIQIVAFPR